MASDQAISPLAHPSFEDDLHSNEFDFNQPPSTIMPGQGASKTSQPMPATSQLPAHHLAPGPSFVSPAVAFGTPQVAQNPYSLPSPQTFAGSPMSTATSALGDATMPAASPPALSFPSAPMSPSLSAVPDVGPSRRQQPSRAAKTNAKPGVMLRARRQERKTPAKPFTTSEKMITIVDSMSKDEMESARNHNIRMACEKKEHERRRNNQSAKRARIRKMSTSVALGDEIDRLRAATARAEAEASMWRDIAYARDAATDFPTLPDKASLWAQHPLGPPPQNQHALEAHYEDEVKDMRRCLSTYVQNQELVAICSQEFHDEIARVLRRGDEIRGAIELSAGPFPSPENPESSSPATESAHGLPLASTTD